MDLLIIAGMHRSGTSLCARLCQALGVYLGEDLLEGGADNPDGYFEDRTVVKTHRKILSALGREWTGKQGFMAFPENWWQRAELRPDVNILQQWVRRLYCEANGRLSGFKDPRTARLLPVWNVLLSELDIRPAFLLCVRNPLSVARSLSYRDGMRAAQSELLWLQHNTAALLAADRYPLKIVPYERWFTEPESQIDELVTFLKESGHASSDDYRNVLSIIDAGQNHDAALTIRPKFAVTEELYHALLLVSQGKASFQVLRQIVGKIAKSEKGMIDSLLLDKGVRYRRAALRRFPLGTGDEIVYHYDDQSAGIMPSSVVAALETCRTFRSLEEHIERVFIQTRMGHSQRAEVECLFHDFLSAGLLAPESSILPAEGPPPSVSRANRIASVGIVTSSRLDSLSRCLHSFIENSRVYGRDNALVVADDSIDVSTRQTCRRLIASIGSQHRVDLLYAGNDEREQYASALIAEGLAPDVVRFALLDTESCGYSMGCNHNALLLHHAGDVVFHADDDIVCSVVAPLSPIDEFRVFSGHNPNTVHCFASRQAALDSGSFVNADLLDAHESLLGLGIAECMKRHGPGVSNPHRAIGDETLRLLQTGRGQVSVTLSGIIGDSGYGSCSGYLTCGGELRQRILESEETYNLATTSREIVQVVRGLTISDGSWCMSYAMGLDDRTLLPPFFPVRRASDTIFGFLLRKCFIESLFGFVPLAVLHAPPEMRQFPRERVWQDGSSFLISDLVLRLMDEFEFGQVLGGVQRLRLLGRHLAEVGSANLPEFEELVRFKVWEGAQSRIEIMLRKLQYYQYKPSYWAEDCLRYLDSLKKAVVEPAYIIPQDLMDGCTLEEARWRSRKVVRLFGELLMAWPDIVDTAKVLRGKGIRVATGA